MDMSNKNSKLRILIFVLLGLLPLAAIALGVILLTADTIVNITFLLTFVIIPVASIIGLALVTFSGKKRIVKVVLNTAVLVLFVLIFLGLNFFGRFEELVCYENDEIADHYVADSHSFMPSLTEVGQPIQTEYYTYYSEFGVVFSWDAGILICKYDDSTYEAQKNIVDTTYDFQTALVEVSGSDVEPSVKIDDYQFRMLSLEGDYKLDYPKYLAFIATNDAENEIGYIWFYDVELDYIESMTDLINNDCGWKYIR